VTDCERTLRPRTFVVRETAGGAEGTDGIGGAVSGARCAGAGEGVGFAGGFDALDETAADVGSIALDAGGAAGFWPCGAGAGGVDTGCVARCAAGIAGAAGADIGADGVAGRVGSVGGVDERAAGGEGGDAGRALTGAEDVAERETVGPEPAGSPADPNGGPTSSAPTAPGPPRAACAAEAACHAAGALGLVGVACVADRALACRGVAAEAAGALPTGSRAMTCERCEASGARAASRPGALRPRAATSRMTASVCTAIGKARRRQRMNGRTGSPRTCPAASP